MNLEELRKKWKGLVEEAEGLSKKDNVSSEDLATINAKLAEADGIAEQIKTAEKLGGHRANLDASAGPKAAHLGWEASKETNEEVETDWKAWREVDVNGRKFRYNVPLAVAKNAKQEKAYAEAFEAYLHYGEGKLAQRFPNDMKTLTEGVDSEGGFLVPPDYQASVIRKVATTVTVRPNALVIQTGRDVVQWPRVVYSQDDRYTSGVRLTWSGAENPATTSHRVNDPVFGMYNIPIHTAMASLPLSLNLLEDAAFDVVGLSSELLAEAFALGENEAFWIGSGAAMPRGLAVSAATTTDKPEHIEWIPSATAAAPTPDEILQLWEALPSQYEANAKWFMRKRTEGFIRRLTTTDGNFIWPVWPQVGNLGEHQREIQGSPVLRDEFVPALDAGAAAFSIFYGDMMGYLIADRVGMSIERVREPYVEQNAMVLLGRKRVGGQVIQPWRLKALSTSST